jgi:hypothetical protein
MVRLGGGQHAGGFVQNQDIGAPVKRLEDLDALLHADADILDPGIGIDAEFIVIGEFLELRARLGQRRAQERSAFGAQHDIFQHREILDQLEMLEHHPDACGNRGLTVGDIGLFARDENLGPHRRGRTRKGSTSASIFLRHSLQ